MNTVVGVPLNDRAPAQADALAAAASAAGVKSRLIHLATLEVDDETGTICDQSGSVEVSHLAPGLVYGELRAVRALAALEQRCAPVLNPQRHVAVADDKLRTAEALAAAGVPQPATVAVPAQNLAAATAVGYPLILKRPHGALGMWVRRVTTRDELAPAATELLAEGGDLLLAQAEVSESLGTAIRAIVVDGAVTAATERVAPSGEWRSNVAQGGAQRAVNLSAAEAAAALSATSAVRLGFAGVDIVRAWNGPLIIEVNAMPGFASMHPYVDVDIAAAVIEAVLRRGTPQH